jgi:hypothetical protein
LHLELEQRRHRIAALNLVGDFLRERGQVVSGQARLENSARRRNQIREPHDRTAAMNAEPNPT